MEESDEDEMDEVKETAEPQQHYEEEEEEIVESDVELEGETVEPDNDPPQKVYIVDLHCVFLYVWFSEAMLDIEIEEFVVVDGRFVC